MVHSTLSKGLASTKIIPVSEVIPEQRSNKAVCAWTSKIYNSNNNYIKTICVLAEGFNFPGASEVCGTYGMKLYAVSNADDFNGLISFSNSIWPNRGASLHIDGRRLSDGSWVVNNPNEVPLYSGAIPTVIEGPCLQFTKLTSGDTFTGANCESVSSFSFCEFY